MQNCELCETAEATLLKAERDEEIVDADGNLTGLTVRLIAICAGCADDWYDGTEDVPGTIPLTELARAEWGCGWSSPAKLVTEQVLEMAANDPAVSDDVFAVIARAVEGRPIFDEVEG